MGWLDFFGSKKKKIADFKNRGAILIDVRTKAEFDLGAISDAKHIPIDDLPQHISEVKSWNTPIVAYCEKGGRSQMAADLLRPHGIEIINGGAYLWLSENW